MSKRNHALFARVCAHHSAAYAAASGFGMPSPDEVAVCNLASIALPRFVTDGDAGAPKFFDHEKLRQITYIVTKNLNRVIDNNFYPVEEARTSNMKHRPIGLGVQGLADVFIHMRLPFDSEGARPMLGLG